MALSREIRGLLFGLLLLFFLVGGAALYWAVVGSESILQREDNPRRVEEEAAIRRGSIVDRDGRLLAETLLSDAGVLERRYTIPATYSALGYFSLRYGVGGAEAAFDAILRGDTLDEGLSTYVEQGILHRPQQGSDIRLTLDAELQTTIQEAMGTRQGAVIVMDVPDGEIRALLSQPAYDPNVLDEQWDMLIEAPGNPFFNRVLQAQYQPGGLLQTPLLSAAILADQPLERVYTDATDAVLVDGVELRCALEPESDDLTLVQAYAYGCPAPFWELAQVIGAAPLQQTVSSFRFPSPTNLAGFTIDVPEPVESTPEATPESTTEAVSFQEEALGQGRVTVRPLGVVAMQAAILNAGNAPQPRILSATRPPDGEWQPVPASGESVPLMTANAAHRIRELMIQTINSGVLGDFGLREFTVGGHVALAYSGDEVQSWFTGFLVLDGGRSVAVAVVLEGSSDPMEAVTVGRAALGHVASTPP